MLLSIPPINFQIEEELLRKDIILILIQSGTLFVTSLGFIKVIIEYIRSQNWKRFEFVANEIKSFNADSDVKLVKMMLDWSGRAIELFPEKSKGKSVIISYLSVEKALTPDDRGLNNEGFTEIEARIRDLFDTFFEWLAFFNQCINGKLIKPTELKPYLSYWVKLISCPSDRDGHDSLVKQLHAYLKKYGYDDVLQLIQRFKSIPENKK